MKGKLLSFLLSLTLAVSAQSSSDTTEESTATSADIPATIRVDRPSFANSSNVVGRGVNSLESGVLVTTSKDGSQALTQTPFLYRHGVNENFELRLGTSGVNFAGDQFGWSDLSPGFKWNFHSDESVSASLVGSLTFPVGNARFRPGSVQPSLSFAVDVPLGSSTSLLWNLGANAPGDGRDRVLQPFTTLGVSQTLSDKWSVYLESAVFAPAAPGESAVTMGDVVVTYLVDSELQLDGAFFKGFSSSGLDWALTFGVSRRF